MSSIQTERIRKFYLALPLLVIPCLTLFFHALGGGNATGTTASKNNHLNMRLPEVQADSEPQGKMSFYIQALKDSNGMEALRKADPYSQDTTSVHGTPLPTGNVMYSHSDSNEVKINESITRLQRTLHQDNNYTSRSNGYESVENRQLKEQLEAVQQQMREMNVHTANEPDPQMQQISNVLDKIRDVQHPASVTERLQKESLLNKGHAFAVGTRSDNVFSPQMNGSFFYPDNAGFYGFPLHTDSVMLDNTPILAEVNENQTLTTGATVKLKLNTDIVVAGQTVTKGAFVFGVCTLEGERMQIAVSSIRYGDNLYPVTLSVYDMDGLAGIRIPEAITGEVTKEGLDQGIQSMNLMTLDPGLGAQAAGAAVQTAKSLFSKKIKLVKATVRAGYTVLLLDKKGKDL